jgi:hypothetical protein
MSPIVLDHSRPSYVAFKIMRTPIRPQNSLIVGFLSNND